MSKKFKALNFICILILFVSSVAFCASPLESKKAYSALLKIKDKSYIMGRFTVIHKNDPKIVPAKYTDGSSELTYECHFVTSIELTNTDTQKKYEINLKPIVGSSTEYYHDEKELEENTAHPFWILEVPSGNYEASAVISRLTLTKGGYFDWRDQLFNKPVFEFTKQRITFNTQAGKVLYIGDFEATFITCVILHSTNALYPFRLFKLDYTKDFEKAKTEFLNGADDEAKTGINENIISI